MKTFIHKISVLISVICVISVPLFGQDIYNNGDTISISSGASIYVNGAMTSTNNGAKHADFINNGTLNITGDLQHASGTVTSGLGWLNLNGSSTQNFSGANYYSIRVSGSGDKILTGSATLKDSLIFQDGSIVMADKDTIYMDSAAWLKELPTNEVYGNIKYTKYLAKNTAYTFGNIGLDFNAFGARPGKTNIIRSTGDSAIQIGTHTSTGVHQGTKRYFDIHPATNLALNASIVFHYSDMELNSIAKSDLALYRSVDTGRSWIYIGYASRDSSLNTLSLGGVNSFSRWTTGSITNPLPVGLLNFNVALKNQQTSELNWSTSTEINNDHFDIERSEDAKTFEKIGEEKGYGTTNTVHNYQYEDHFGVVMVPVLYYRLKQVDYNGAFTYSEIRKVNLSNQLQKFHAWYNAAADKTEADVYYEKETKASIRMIDIQGKLIAEQSSNFSAGSTHISLTMLGLAQGIYTLSIVDENGAEVKRVLKY